MWVTFFQKGIASESTDPEKGDDSFIDRILAEIGVYIPACELSEKNGMLKLNVAPVSTPYVADAYLVS